MSTLPPFGPIEGQKWFFQFSSHQSLRLTGLHLSISAKSSAFEISHSCRTASADRFIHAYKIIWFGKNIFKMTAGISDILSDICQELENLSLKK
jgi:hypothetical protein